MGDSSYYITRLDSLGYYISASLNYPFSNYKKRVSGKNGFGPLEPLPLTPPPFFKSCQPKKKKNKVPNLGFFFLFLFVYSW